MSQATLGIPTVYGSEVLLDELPNGTYQVDDDGNYIDYGEKWSYGYMVGVQALEGEPQPGKMIGVWRKNGVLYVDEVVHVDSLCAAKQLAKKFNQTTVWDLYENKEVYL